MVQPPPAPFVKDPPRDSASERKKEIKNNAAAGQGLRAVEGGAGVGIAAIGKGTRDLGSNRHDGASGGITYAGLNGELGPVEFHPVMLDGTDDFPQNRFLLAALSLQVVVQGKYLPERIRESVENRQENLTDAPLSARVSIPDFTPQITSGLRGSVRGPGKMTV
jgi:hypothetical protein